MAPKKRIMKEFSIAEISAVDEPAQEPARMAIMKAKGDTKPVKRQPRSEKEDLMSKTAEELQAELDKSADALVKAKAATDRATQVSELSDVEKAHMESLGTAKAKDTFLAKSAEDRKITIDAALSKAKEADPVIFKSMNGTEYRKSDDDRLVEMAKRDDLRENELAKMRDDATTDAFEKRGATNFAKFKGEGSVKGELAKAIAGIKNDDTRAGVEEMLKAAHAAVGLTLKEVGSKADDFSTDDEDDTASSKKSAEAKLDTLAKAKAEKDSIPFAKAYASVLASDEGSKLYSQSVA